MQFRLPSITDEQFVKIRCSTHNQTYYFEATGTLYAQPMDGDQPCHLFNFLGVDISRCIQDENTGRWFLLSRKISLYFDPQTGTLLKSWQNPWSGETLNVMHRSYDYQEFEIPQQLSAFIAPEVSAVSIDVNLKVPNPLAQNPKFAEYSPEQWIQSSDCYKFLFPTSMLEESSEEEINPRAVTLSYYRMGPWEPWMKMNGKPGFLVINYTGTKTETFTELHPELQRLITQRMPLFYEAPAYRLQRSIATSWSRFEAAFDAYLRGEEFPLPAPIQAEPAL
jgi:hypothetical protein